VCVGLYSPDQEAAALCSYVEQLAVQNPLRLYTVSYECEHQQANVSHLLISFYYYTHTRLTAFCPGLPGWAGTRKVKPIWILLKQETVSGSGISWTVCKSAPRPDR